MFYLLTQYIISITYLSYLIYFNCTYEHMKKSQIIMFKEKKKKLIQYAKESLN